MLQNFSKKLAYVPVRIKRVTWLYNRVIGFIVRRGIVPHLIPEKDILEALRATKPSGVLEMFGLLKMRIRRVATGLWEDYGVVSVKLVTTAFAAYVVDSLQDSSTYPLDDFRYHQMGDDNTTESNAHTDLQNAREAKVSGSNGEGGSANIFQTVATIEATAGYDVEEHSITSNASNASGTMLDRNLVPNAPTVIANDQVEFTYDLTVNAES